jgi:acyl-CoA thioester hydrolase
MAGASVEIKRFLEWAETDAAGHQHYSSAFRWVEECEAALYRSVKVAMEYKRRIFFGEEIRTRLEVIRIGNSSLELAFTADVDGEIAAIGNYVIVHSPNKEAGAQRWPDAWRAKLFTE